MDFATAGLKAIPKVDGMAYVRDASSAEPKAGLWGDEMELAMETS